MIDMSPEAIAKRRKERNKQRELAESVWNTMMNEGDEYEKEYWIKGYCVRMGNEEISNEEIEKGAIEWYEKEGTYKPSAIALKTWIRGAKWYKEQLKK